MLKSQVGSCITSQFKRCLKTRQVQKSRHSTRSTEICSPGNTSQSKSPRISKILMSSSWTYQTWRYWGLKVPLRQCLNQFRDFTLESIPIRHLRMLSRSASPNQLVHPTWQKVTLYTWMDCSIRRSTNTTDDRDEDSCWIKHNKQLLMTKSKISKKHSRDQISRQNIHIFRFTMIQF